MARVAVLGIVEEGDGEVGFRKTRPVVGAYLEAGNIPCSVGMGGPADVAKLDFVGGVVAEQGERELNLQKLQRLPPVEAAFEIQADRFGAKGDALGENAHGTDFDLKFNGGAERTRFDGCHPADLGSAAFFEVADIGQ